MTQNTSVAEYYETTVPELFASAIANASDDVTGQPELTATYEVTGEGGGTYGVRIGDGQIEIVPGGIEGSDMYVTARHEDWSRGAEEGQANPIEYYVRRKVSVIKGIKGAVNLDLAQDDAPNYEGRIVFGGVDTPEVTMRMKAHDYADMMSGKLNGQMAFMTGKLKFEGSLPLLMQLGALSA